VDYALYVDAILQLGIIHPTFSTSICENKTLHNKAEEIALITKAKATSRPNITHNLPILELQRDTYAAFV
jgi:hypothetical protein